MRKKMIWGFVTLIILLIGVAVVLLLHNTDTDLITIYKGDTEPIKQAIDETVNDATAEKTTESSDVATPKKKIEYATEPSGYHKEGVEGMYVTHMPRDPDRFAHLPEPPLPPSAVPEDCPEHLILKPEWRNGVYFNIEPPPSNGELSDETKIRIRNILLEIVREYNPKRPYVEIWDQFIEYEKMYRDYAEYELGYTPMAILGANRLDWIYEQTWAFPEFVELGESQTAPHGEENRFLEAVDVAMGYLNHDWNKITLKDGRDFFIKGNSRYEFVYSGVTEEGN